MNTRNEQPNRTREQRRPSKLTAARLDKLIEEATVDAYDASEQLVGLYTLMEDSLALPFKTQVLGVDVSVERIELTEADEIVAICTRSRMRQAIPILKLPLPTPPPQGAEWIEAYRRWARRTLERR